MKNGFSYTYFMMVIFTSIAYLIADFSKVITKQYGLCMLIALLFLAVTARFGIITFQSAGKILFLPLIAPVVPWLYWGDVFLGKLALLGVFWHIFVGVFPFLTHLMPQHHK